MINVVEKINSISLPESLIRISERIIEKGGKSYLVGGFVRDTLLGLKSKDYDIEIYNLELKDIIKILSDFGIPDLVGKSFGVMKLRVDKNDYDFSLPRSDSKIGKGHKGFDVKSDPFMTFEEASFRRDFTINSMGIEIPSKRFEDPHGGLKDLENKILRHVSEHFNEDPLRAMRAVQFAARFEFEIPKETKEIISKQLLEELPSERIFDELKKLLLKSKKPSIGFEIIKEVGFLKYFPELKKIVGLQQDPEWHPEGDVWTHTMLALDQAAIIRDKEISEEDEFKRLAYMLGVLAHDFGKSYTTIFKEGRWRSPSHEAAGEVPTRSFLSRLTKERKLIDLVVLYVTHHLRPSLLFKAKKVKKSAIRRLALKVNISDIVRINKADHRGKLAVNDEFEAGDWLLEQAKNLDVIEEVPKPILTGKMLISLGVNPGPEMGEIIKESFDLQLDDKIISEEEALNWARERIKNA